MEYLAEVMLSGGRINGAIVGAVFGAIGAVLGGLIGSCLKRFFKREGVIKWTMIIFILLFLQIPKTLRPYLEETYGEARKYNEIHSIMKQLEEQKLFSVLFQYHPDAKKQLSERFRAIVYDKSIGDADVRRLSQEASAEIVGTYFQKHLPAASDVQTSNLLKRNHIVLLKFMVKPELCVGYYLGKPIFSPEDLTPEFIKAESDIKAEIIQSAISNPSIPPRAASAEEIFAIIAEGYDQKGYSPENLALLDSVGQIDATKGCQVAIEFSDVLASLEPKMASYVFKNLMYLGSEIESQ